MASHIGILAKKRDRRTRALESSINGIAKTKVPEPTASFINVLSTSTTDVRIAGNRLRQALQATFPANSAKPTSYLNVPVVTVSKKTARGRTVS